MNKIKHYWSAFMKLERKQKYLLFEKLFLALFPSPRASVNFLALFAFFGVLTDRENPPLILLVAILGVLYCYNEWVKEVLKK